MVAKKTGFQSVARTVVYGLVGFACLTLTACQTVPTAPGESQASAKGAVVAKGKPAANATVVEGVAGRVWSIAASAELTYSAALAHCKNQPAYQGQAWQLPSFYQLARAPLGIYEFPSGTRLWSDSAPDRLPLKRFLVDVERPFGKFSTDLRDGQRFPALCTALASS